MQPFPGYARTTAADDSGFVYETKMSALVAMRLFSCVDEFYLASNLGKAGKFDDIVFSARKDESWNVYFVQLKHKVTKKKISLQSLYRGTKGADDFCIFKYFESFVDTTKNLREGRDVIFGKPNAVTKFIIFTNGLLHQDVLMRHQKSVNIGLLSTNPETELNFKLGHETDGELINHLGRVGGNWVEPFLDKFYFCSGQVDEAGVDQLVYEEISKLTKLSPVEVTNVVSQLYDHVRRKNREGQYFTQDDINTILAKATLYAQSGKKSVTKIKFENYFLHDLYKNLVPGKPILLQCAVDKTLMCMAALKQLELLDEPNHEVSLRNLESDDFHHILYLWRQGSERALVIDCEVDSFNINQELIVPRLHELSEANPKNRIILVAGKDNTIAIKIASDLNAGKQRFNCSLKNLVEESKNLLLECELKFQGYETPLSSITAGSKLFDDVFDMASMTLLLVGGQIDVGIKPVEQIEYYVPRILTRKTVSSEVFSNLPPGNTIVVSGITSKRATATLPFPPSEIGLSSDQVIQKDGYPTKRVYILDGLSSSAEFEKLSKLNSNIHWLENLGKSKITWSWRRSTGDVGWVLNNLTDSLVYATTDNIMNIEDKVVVVAAEPGMGKSTLLDHLAAQTKTQCPHMWVISLQLNDFSDHLSNDDFFKDIKKSVKNLIAAAAGVDSTTSKFNARLFNHCYDVTGNMIVLLDGFDEITPTYTKEGLYLIRELQSTSISRIWVTSRPVWASLLQTTTSTICFTIQSLGEKEQKSFLQKFWGQKANADKIENLTVFIDNVLKLIRGSFDKDLNEFTGIPLQTRMIAEAFDPNEPLPKQINGLELFQRFVETKIEISFKDKLKVPSTNARLLSEVRNMRGRMEEKLTQLALLTLLPLEACAVLTPPITREIFMELRQLVQEGSENAGLVVSFTSASPQFIHRTFAEYFFALFLAKSYRFNRPFLISNTFFSPLFSFVQYFFNRILAMNKPLHQIVLARENQSLFAEANEKKNELNSWDEGGRTALHMAAMQPDGKEAIEILLKAGADANKVDAVLDWNPLDYAIRMNHTENIGSLLEASKPSGPIGAIVPITWESLRLAISGDYLQLLLHLFDQDIASTVGMHVLSPETWIGNATCAKLTLLHVAAYYNASKILEYLLSPSNRDCKLSQLECIDEKGRTPLLLAASNGSSHAAWLLVEANANLNAKTEDGKNVVELAVDFQDDVLLKLTLTAMKSRGLNQTNLLTGAVTALMGTKSDWGLQVLDSLLVNYPELIHSTTKKGVPLISAASTKGNYGVVELLSKHVDVNVVHKGSTPLHFAVRGGHKEVVEILLRCPNIRINAIDGNGDTPYTMAASMDHYDIALLLVGHGADMKSRSEREAGLQEMDSRSSFRTEPTSFSARPSAPFLGPGAGISMGGGQSVLSVFDDFLQSSSSHQKSPVEAAPKMPWMKTQVEEQVETLAREVSRLKFQEQLAKNKKYDHNPTQKISKQEVDLDATAILSKLTPEQIRALAELANKKEAKEQKRNRPKKDKKGKAPGTNHPQPAAAVPKTFTKPWYGKNPGHNQYQGYQQQEAPAQQPFYSRNQEPKQQEQPAHQPFYNRNQEPKQPLLPDPPKSKPSFAAFHQRMGKNVPAVRDEEGIPGIPPPKGPPQHRPQGQHFFQQRRNQPEPLMSIRPNHPSGAPPFRPRPPNPRFNSPQNNQQHQPRFHPNRPQGRGNRHGPPHQNFNSRPQWD